MAEWDVVVVGAGIVGLACAERLTRGGLSALVIERHAAAGTETTSRSSQVVHAGMYYPTGSLKAELCVRGNASLGAWCEAHGMPMPRVGKLIVATDEPGEAELARLLAQGRSNGCPALEYAERSLLDAEPHVMARAALWSARTAIVDAHALVGSLAAATRAQGGDLALCHELVGAAQEGAGYALRIRDPRGEESVVSAPRVINAAGLGSDDLAAMIGIDVDAAGYRQRFVKGSYFRLRGRGLASRLIYPVPPADLAGLGVHVTLDLDGSVRLGPDVEPLAGRTLDYRVDEGRRPAFFAAARTYLRGLCEEDFSPDQAGIRPKLTRPGEPARDFVIAEESARGLPGWVNLVGIESPGLTSALEIGERVAGLFS